MLVAVLYFVAGWIGSSIARNPDWRQPDSGIAIMIETNGTHTGIVMPVATSVKDWRETFPEIARERGGQTTHIAVGWGEREVFLHVPTWGDLSPFTALRITLIGGDSLIRVSHYVRPAPSQYHRPLRVTREQYRRITRRVEASLAPPGPGGAREVLRGTYQADAYYQARDRYTLLRTSNSWTGDVLGDAGVRIGLWTPFAGGVMKWFEAPQEG